MAEMRLARGVFREGFWGLKPLPFLGNFFNFLGVLIKKTQTPPLNFPFYTKIFQNPSLEKFLDTPLRLVP